MVYLSVALKSFSRNLAYRSEVWLRVVGNLVTIFIQISIWKALLSSSAVDGTGTSLQDMVTYSIVSTLVVSVLMTQVFREVDNKINDGNIAVDLLKPIYFPLILFSQQLGNVLFNLIFTVMPSLIIAWMLFDIRFPDDPKYWLMFAFSILLALGISFLLGYLIGLVAFWFLTTFAVEWTVMALVLVFSGSFLPLWFFSGVWRTMAENLPFQYLGYVPSAIFAEKLELEKALYCLGLGSLWTIGLLFLVWVLWTKAIKNLTVQGG
ncbi:ABC transporter permease [Paenibacillus sp. MMS18-CY102]|uniref:ABC transporter permease n=1 Tax=Paenibacillus sp. MMS18-CY102 TaxID=2682849 RepID=UPI001365D4E6|nr:ABC-2 family transporter protein [Paenibacillus sp. MMS18-CY102]MWC30575.1 hypothetical protein [Paenibacillus sp. MMS18-CY102]